MILFIDSTDFNSVTYALKSANKIIRKSYKIDFYKSHETLAKLDEFLESARANLNQIKKIIANKGPGSYTGTRVGVVHAQALGFAFKVPVKFLSADKFRIG